MPKPETIYLDCTKLLGVAWEYENNLPITDLPREMLQMGQTREGARMYPYIMLPNGTRYFLRTDTVIHFVGEPSVSTDNEF